jgi:hypothetical protein
MLHATPVAPGLPVFIDTYYVTNVDLAIQEGARAWAHGP